MKTENLKVGDVLIAINNCKMDECLEKGQNALTVGKEYVIRDVSELDIIINSNLFAVHEFDKENIYNYFKLKETPKGKHIGYIYPFETYVYEKVKDKIILINSFDNGEYELVCKNYNCAIAQEIVESFEKYYEPVEEKITIGGNEFFIEEWRTFEIQTILRWIKNEPNLAEKLQLIINKKEGK